MLDLRLGSFFEMGGVGGGGGLVPGWKVGRGDGGLRGAWRGGGGMVQR